MTPADWEKHFISCLPNNHYSKLTGLLFPNLSTFTLTDTCYCGCILQLMLDVIFFNLYFIPQVGKTNSFYLEQAIIRADVLFDFHLDNTLRMLSESVNMSRLLVWLLSFESFVLVAVWKTGCCCICSCLWESVSVTVSCLCQLCVYQSFSVILLYYFCLNI